MTPTRRPCRTPGGGACRGMDPSSFGPRSLLATARAHSRACPSILASGRNGVRIGPSVVRPMHTMPGRPAVVAHCAAVYVCTYRQAHALDGSEQGGCEKKVDRSVLVAGSVTSTSTHM